MRLKPASTVYGDDCLLCFDANKTPLHMKVFLSGIERSQWWNPFWKAAPNGYIDLVQDNEVPCSWDSEVAVYPLASFHMDAQDSILQVWTAHDVMAFVSHGGAPCVYSFDNEFVGQFPIGFQDGSASIRLVGTASGGGGSPPPNISEMVTQVTPMTGADPRISSHPISKHKEVIGYSDLDTHTSIQILFDNTP